MITLNVGDEFDIFAKGFLFAVTVVYVSDQVLRFKLTCKTQEFVVEKRLLIKSRHPYKLLSANFNFTHDKAGERLEWIFYYLDDYMTGSKPKYFRNKA